MIEAVVRYLHGARVPFRLSSYPSEESEPKAAHPVPPGGVFVETQLVSIDGRPAITCFRIGEAPDLAAVGSLLGGSAIGATTADLPDEFRYVRGSIPPLGQLFGLPLVLDERVTHAGVLIFRAFDESDYFDIPYEDFARLEQPRVASFASLGELPIAGT